jgi:hypothetical protein
VGSRPEHPGSADITLTTDVSASELRFRNVPQTRVRFAGSPDYDCASGSDRTNLSEPVKVGVTYRDVVVNYRLAAKLKAPRRKRKR